ncbi:MAG: VOC family protein [Actinomycetota bacterium]
MSTLVPYLTFADGNASLAFLTGVLGFEIVTEQRDDDGGVVHAELTRGDAVIMGGDGDAERGTAPGLYLAVDDVPARYEAAIAAGATVGYPPEQTEWGTWRARFVDPDGHEWSVGTYQPGQSW